IAELGPSVEVGDAAAERPPGHAAFGVDLLAPVDAEVVAVMDGGLGAQDAALRGVSLIVKFDGVAIDAMFDAYSLGPAFEVTDHLTLNGQISQKFSGEVISDFKRRAEGVRVKHSVNRNSAKLHQKCSPP